MTLSEAIDVVVQALRAAGARATSDPRNLNPPFNPRKLNPGDMACIAGDTK